MNWSLPEPVRSVVSTLERAGYEAYLVGGCVRDHLLGRGPKDYDITTNARPEQVIPLFEKVIPRGIQYGTVAILIDGMEIEVTTYRADGNYSDGRRPDTVRFGSSVEDDLSRRDFTMNAIAWAPARGLVDPFDGSGDLQAGLIRAVGDPAERFREDALRMLRAVRFATVLGFELAPGLADSILAQASMLENVSIERVRDELTKILLSAAPLQGLRLLFKVGLLSRFLPELAACHGFEQHNAHHRYDVFEHIGRVVNALPPALHLRLSGLLHDIAKPVTFTQDESGVGHFYAHDHQGAEMAEGILRQLKVDGATIDKVVLLVREHMFPAEMGTKGIRRFIARVGAENVPDLMELRLADIAGSGVPDDLSHVDRILAMAEQMKTEGVANPRVALAISGHDVMHTLGLPPGKQVGAILAALGERILDAPALNERETLLALLPEVANNDS